jgi:hypothetical protein
MTENYMKDVVSCTICGAELKESEREFLARDIDFLAHGSPKHLIRIELKEEER